MNNNNNDKILFYNGTNWNKSPNWLDIAIGISISKDLAIHQKKITESYDPIKHKCKIKLNKIQYNKTPIIFSLYRYFINNSISSSRLEQKRKLHQDITLAALGKLFVVQPKSIDKYLKWLEEYDYISIKRKNGVGLCITIKLNKILSYEEQINKPQTTGTNKKNKPQTKADPENVICEIDNTKDIPIWKNAINKKKIENKTDDTFNNKLHLILKLTRENPNDRFSIIAKYLSLEDYINLINKIFQCAVNKQYDYIENLLNILNFTDRVLCDIFRNKTGEDVANIHYAYKNLLNFCLQNNLEIHDEIEEYYNKVKDDPIFQLTT